MWENLAGQGEGEKANLRKGVIGGNLAFGIGWWGANQSGSSLVKSCGKILWEILQENLVGNCCRKILWENLVGNLAGNSCGKVLREILWEILQEILWEILWKMLWEIPHTYLQTISEGNFQNMQFI